LTASDRPPAASTTPAAVTEALSRVSDGDARQTRNRVGGFLDSESSSVRDPESRGVTDDERWFRLAIHPKVPKDLALAPVAAAIDLNLVHLRDKSPAEIEFALALTLNRTTSDGNRADRAAWVLDEAVRGVEMHAWHTEITADSARLRLSGGSVMIDLGLSASILHYIENGVAPV
jgi:hypothetical protein